MTHRNSEAEEVPLTKRASRYCGEMIKILQVIDRTPSSDWSSLSSMLTQGIRCIESHTDVVGEAIPDPDLLSRAIWKCLDPQGVMGVQRKALDVLHRLMQCNGCLTFLQQMPLLMSGVLDLVPRCSMQLKCELLHFVKVNLLQSLPHDVVALELPSLIEAIIGGFEESESSEVYRETLSLMQAIHSAMENASAEGTGSDTQDDNRRANNALDSHKPLRVGLEHEFGNDDRDGEQQGIRHQGLKVVQGDALVYRALWFTLKNSPSLRGSVLIYLRLKLCSSAQLNEKSVNHNLDGTEGNISLRTNANANENSSNNLTQNDLTRSIFTGGDPRLVHSALFAALQGHNERTRRLVLDILIAGFPLGTPSLFDFTEQSLLVAAVVQLLGLPGVPSSIRRRVGEWLSGPALESAASFAHDVTSFLVAQAFHGVLQWWEGRRGVRCASRTPTATTTSGGRNEFYYDVLFASACASQGGDDAATQGQGAPTTAFSVATMMGRGEPGGGRGEERAQCDVDLLPLVWLQALAQLFRLVVDPDGQRTADPIAGFGYDLDKNDDSVNRSQVIACSPFLEHVAPLAMPYVCDLLVSMKLNHRGRALDAALGKLFEIVQWDYFTNYERGIVLMLRKAVERLDNTKDASLLSADFHQWFQQLRGIAGVVETHVVGASGGNAQQSATFQRDALDVCKSLCDVIELACVSIVNSSTAGVTSAAWTAATSQLINGCLETLSVVFLGTCMTLQERIGTAESCEMESTLLRSLLEAATSCATLAGRGTESSEVWGDIFGQIGDTAFSFLSRLRQRLSSSSVSSSSCSSASSVLSALLNPFALCEEALQRWIDAVAKVASVACAATQEAALRLYVDLLQSAILPDALYAGMRSQGLTARLAPRLWRLLGVASAGGHRRVVNLLVRLYALPEGRLVLDEVTKKPTAENGARLVLIFRVLAESGSTTDLFVPGLFMMLRANSDIRLSGDELLRQRAEALVRQSLLVFHRLLYPLLTHRSTGKLEPLEFTRLLRGCLTTAGRGGYGASPPQQLLQQLEQIAPPPSYLDFALKNGLPMNSVLEVLCHLLLDMVSRSILNPLGYANNSTEGGSLGMTSHDTHSEDKQRVGTMTEPANDENSTSSNSMSTCNDKEDALCVEACETLSVLLEICLRHPHPPDSVRCIWGDIGEGIVPLLRAAVSRRLPITQQLLLRHLVDTLHFLDAPLTPSCIHVLNSRLFTETVEMALAEAVSMALLPREDPYDLLSVWTNALLELLPFLHNDTETMLSRLLNAFLRQIDELLRLSVPTDTMAILISMEKCIAGVHGVLQHHLTITHVSTMQSTEPQRRGFNGWSLFSSSPTTAEPHQAMERPHDTAIPLAMPLVVSTLCEAHNSARGARRRHPDTHEAAARAESAVERIFQLCAKETEMLFICSFVDVWAAKHARSIAELMSQWRVANLTVSLEDPDDAHRPFRSLSCAVAAAATTTTTRAIPMETAERIGEKIPTYTPTFAGKKSASEEATVVSHLSECEALASLLHTGACVSALTLIRVAENLLTQHRTAPTNTPHSGLVVVAATLPGGKETTPTTTTATASELPFDAVILYFIHNFLRAACVSGEDAPQVLHVLIDLILSHLSAGAPSTLSFPLLLQVLAHFDTPNSVKGGAVDWGRDRRCSIVICKTLDYFGTASLHTSNDVASLLFSLRVLASTLPSLAQHSPSDQDRIATASLNFYKRSLLPTILFGIDSHTEADVRARVPLVKAALSATRTLLCLGDMVSRRLRQELLETLFKCDFFRFPRGVLHEWTCIFERLSQDRTFHTAAVQFFTPSSSPSSRLAALVSSAEEEARQSVRQLKRLAFYVLGMPPSLVMADREFCLLLRERITDTFYSFPYNTRSKRPPSFRPTRHALFLFRVLVTKLSPALLRSYWPLIFPEVLRALRVTTPSTHESDAMSRKGTVAERDPRRELLALQMECLKLLDFVVVIAPESFAACRWVFLDDMAACSVSTQRPENTWPFIPAVRRVAVGAAATLPVSISKERALLPNAWCGSQRPLFYVPPVSYGTLRGAHGWAAALNLFSQSAFAPYETPQGATNTTPGVHARLRDGWDEVYVRALLEADFSCVAEEE